jgi:hypothetical protein
MAGGTRLPGPRAVLGERRPGSGCRPQPHRRGGGGLLDVGFDSTRSLPRAEPSRARARPPPAGLAAQPIPGRPGRGRAGLRAGQAAGQHECRRPGAGYHLAVAAQGFPTPRLGLPARNPEAVRQRALAAARSVMMQSSRSCPARTSGIKTPQARIDSGKPPKNSIGRRSEPLGKRSRSTTQRWGRWHRRHNSPSLLFHPAPSGGLEAVQPILVHQSLLAIDHAPIAKVCALMEARAHPDVLPGQGLRRPTVS